MKRLFFALWPSDSTRQQLTMVNQQIKVQGLRKIKPDNLHVTLVFLGNVSDEIAAAVELEAAMIKAEPFKFQFDALEYWARPRVLCLTAGFQPLALYQLVERLTEMVLRYPVQLEQRPYRAHVTLARKAKDELSLNFDVIPWQANDFVLVQSQSTEQGVHYEVIARWPLSG